MIIKKYENEINKTVNLLNNLEKFKKSSVNIYGSAENEYML